MTEHTMEKLLQLPMKDVVLLMPDLNEEEIIGYFTHQALKEKDNFEAEGFPLLKSLMLTAHKLNNMEAVRALLKQLNSNDVDILGRTSNTEALKLMLGVILDVNYTTNERVAELYAN